MPVLLLHIPLRGAETLYGHLVGSLAAHEHRILTVADPFAQRDVCRCEESHDRRQQHEIERPAHERPPLQMQVSASEFDETDVLPEHLHLLLRHAAALHHHRVLKTALTVRQHVVETIENHLCFVLSNDEGSDAQVVALELCKETLAYFMANDAEKTLLEKIFDVIAQKAKTVDRVKIKRYSKSMLGIDDALIIEAWLAETQFIEQQFSDSEIFEMLLSFFIDTHKIGKTEEYFPDICRMWLDGYSFIAMQKATGLLIPDIESLCSKLISYEFSFFIGNIIDVIDDDDDENRALLVSKLLLLQRKLKYGVCSETAISICEKVFNDRLLANSIAEQIGAESIDTNHIIDALKMCKEKILGFLSVYPTYFSVRINWICK